MTNYEKILKEAKKNNGHITTKQVVDLNIDKKFLTNLVEKGELIKLSRGYYGTVDCYDDEFYKIQSKSKNAIFSLATALYFHNLSNRTPLVLNITLPYGYNGSLQNEKKVILNFVKRELLDLGVVEMESPFGMKVKVYDVERTICDIVKYRNKIDGEIFAEALKDYAKSKSKDINKLMKYAKLMKIDKKIVEYMGVLL